MFSLSFFGSAYLLLGWFEYLKLDGVGFLNSKVFIYLKNILISLDRFSYKSKGVYNVDNEPIEEYKTSGEITKASIFAYILSGLILLIGAQILIP